MCVYLFIFANKYIKVKNKMRQIKYFSEMYCDMEDTMNKWLTENNKNINYIYRIHINAEMLYAGNVCVNGFIDYETIGGK